ncbi:antibiotic biosynthesis monooxygenase [Amycolatopsis sp. WQ 127309]|uniref:antibiotic biosynthesis monooxygenase family protein n=1 Tax=Amycolatopsis sp. WQ 127309 TaxID=2932773 RepID=UPI001FF251E4|nr:antibiotic biosynthesis monooxygenase [Amycolatopsis sp. WQ 127309]UOZ03441.1 antibiotic biosynthesis monooxygenase [Amycolatopsis sp. WQ 127309]
MEQANLVFINCFQVPVGRDEAFIELWNRIDAYMVHKPGYLWNRLHKSIDDAAANRFVNVVGWESKELFDAAHDEEYRAMRQGPEWQEFGSTPALYTIHREAMAGGA